MRDKMGDLDTSLIQEFSNRPAFYNKTNPHYKDKIYVEQAWLEISAKLGYDVPLLKDRIYQLRNRYNLEKRKVESMRLEGVADAKSSWALFNYLTFLDSHIRPRKSYKSMMRRSMHDIPGNLDHLGLVAAHHNGGGITGYHPHPHQHQHLHNHQHQHQPHHQQHHHNGSGYLSVHQQHQQLQHQHQHHLKQQQMQQLQQQQHQQQQNVSMHLDQMVAAAGLGLGGMHGVGEMLEQPVEIKFEHNGGDGGSEQNDMPEVFDCDFDNADDEARNSQSQNGDHFINPAQFLDDTESEHDPNGELAQATNRHSNNNVLPDSRASAAANNSGTNLLLRNINSLKRSYASASNNDLPTSNNANNNNNGNKLFGGNKFKMPRNTQYGGLGGNSSNGNGNGNASSSSIHNSTMHHHNSSVRNNSSSSSGHNHSRQNFVQLLQQQQQQPVHQSTDKFNAFGLFLTSALLDMPEDRALILVEKFTNDLVRSLVQKAVTQTEKTATKSSSSSAAAAAAAAAVEQPASGTSSASGDDRANTPATPQSSASTVDENNV